MTAVSPFQVKVLYARNLTQDCTEDSLKQAFEVYGKIERVKKIKDYAFIHFEERENALKVRFVRLIVYKIYQLYALSNNVTISVKCCFSQLKV